jgi:hypothetical protein
MSFPLFFLFSSTFTSVHDTPCSAIPYISLMFPSQLCLFLSMSAVLCIFYFLFHICSMSFLPMTLPVFFPLFALFHFCVSYHLFCQHLKTPPLPVIRIYFLLINFFLPTLSSTCVLLHSSARYSLIFLCYPICALLHFCIWHFSIFHLHSVSNSLNFCAHHFLHTSFLNLNVFYRFCIWHFSIPSCVLLYLFYVISVCGTTFVSFSILYNF